MTRKYTSEFKKTLVELYEAGTPIADLSREYGVSTQALYRWVRRYGHNGNPDNPTRDEVMQLKQQMARMQEENEILKKSLIHIRQEISSQSLCQTVQTLNERDGYPVSHLCEALDVARSTYYDWLHARPSQRAQETCRLDQAILVAYLNSGKRYGAPRIHQDLCAEGWQVSLKRVQRWMQVLSIQSVTIPKFKPRHQASDASSTRHNILQGNFSTPQANRKWVADITYILTQKDGWCYLSSIQDLYSRRVISWNLSRVMDTECVLATLNQAVASRTIEGDLILHTDQGTQYTSKAFNQRLAHHQIQQSYSADVSMKSRTQFGRINMKGGVPYDPQIWSLYLSFLPLHRLKHQGSLNPVTTKESLTASFASCNRMESIPLFSLLINDFL